MARRWTSRTCLHDRDTIRIPTATISRRFRPQTTPNVSPNWMVDMPSYIQGEDIVVPPDHYFAMGDHRGVSLDSRYWGFIPKQNVIGRPMFIYWSFDTPDDQYRKTAWRDRIVHSRQSGPALFRRDAMEADAAALCR